MRVRKVAKQLKRLHRNNKYKVGSIYAKTDYIIRMTRGNWFGLTKLNKKGDEWLHKWITHSSQKYDILGEILEYWGVKPTER